MAKEMILIPISDWERRVKACLESKQDNESQPEKEMATVKLIESNGGRPSSEEVSYQIDDIIKMLPKTYRARASSLLQHLSHVLGRDKRLTYFDGARSSHIIDLLRFVLSPLRSKVSPFDINQFYDLLRKLDVPESAYIVHASSAYAPPAPDAGGWLVLQ